ncbi:P-loop containing nucleoside triphosphate hydrolase protein [Rhizophagus irregularis DAOM 181602=DAOM 197198]|uniref:Tubulin-dependent ATPase KIP3 n=4 Tax=Rhizophagus irregularis TaxID=588596 RepID=A0A015I360_RHIIW|nr:tubulin-dependent ATPase KIP3 [Rhizophagus irregularis DAOM 197198w]GBC24953.1 P-loop containing nucleoside triphosphate hydrolase protein [Rhizophagus irregularis DAOM 181602=DAOM 197198]
MTSTSVRVALRVRPLNKKETQQNCNKSLTTISDAPQILIGNDKSFTFDHVFPSDTEQEEVFQECASPLVEKLVKGYNVTMLAYGQTGSGKTYSMGTALDGSNILPEHQGIIQRAIRKLFADLHERKEKNPSYQFEVYVSFLELYNEVLIDLLNPQSRENNKKGRSDLMIREDTNGQIHWAGVREVQVSGPDELLGQLQKGSLCRTVASTDMNIVSSRSHAIFSVILKQTGIENLEENKENDDPPAQKSLTSKVTSKFHFVDLAGSERLKRTNSIGDREKEGIAINGSLLALGNVISALGDESRNVTHIPYRDSKLTRLLQDSLGGNSQTLMLACVSPADSNFMETLNTLKYANRARNIKNKVSVNESYNGNSVEINQLCGQISRLKVEIQNLRAGGCNEETSRKYEEEIKSLKEELGMTKMKLQNVEQELKKTVNAEKNTFLMEISFNDEGLSDNDREHRIKTHHIIQGYETEIKNPKDQIAELLTAQAAQHPYKASLAEKDHIKFPDPHIFSSDEDIYHQNNDRNSNKESGEKKGKKKKKRSSKKSKTRANDHFPVSDETSNKISLVDPSSSCQLDEHIVSEGESFKITQKLKRRSNTREKFEKANEQLRQSYMIINNGDPLYDDPLVIQQPSSTNSESYIDQIIPNYSKEKRRSSSEYFGENQTIEVPEWEKRLSSVSPSEIPAVEESNSDDEPISPYSTKSDSSQYCTSCSSRNALALAHELRQIHADIIVKEHLISQLEFAVKQYTNMRNQYEQRLDDMQEALQQERDAAVKRAQNASTRDKNSILAVELKARYEHKMNRLIQEATQNATSKNQNETMLKNMRAQIEQLKSEKSRMIKRMNDVREMTERNQREIQNLRRKKKAAQERMNRLERTSEMQKIMLEKRRKKVLQTNEKLKSVMALLKRTTTPKLIAKAFRDHSAPNNCEDGKEPRRSSDDLSPIYDEVFASGYDKKKLLYEAICKYISGRQTLAVMDEWIVRRNNLQEEKNELLEEQERINSTCEIGNELRGYAQALDDKIEIITSEIACINAEIHSLQSSIAADQEENYIKTDKAEKKLPFILPEVASHEALYDYVFRVLQNLDQFESYTILESFFKDIIKLRTGYRSLQMILEQRERTIMDLRKSLLTSKYEKKSRFLEEALRLDGRSLSPSTPEKRELQMDDIENSTSNAISFEAAVSAGTLGTPCQMGLSSRRNLYLLNLQLREKVSERTNEIQSSTPDVPTNSKRKDSGNSDYSSGSIGYNDVKRSLNGRRLKNGPSTPNDENISPSIELGNLHLERTSSLNSQFFKRTRSCSQPLERSRSSDQHLERRKPSVQFSSSLHVGSTILAHSRQSSLTSLYLESGGNVSRDSGHFGNC